VHGFFCTEQDESEGASVSLDKVLNCAMSCISVAFPHDIISQKKNVLEVILNSLSPEESWQGMTFNARSVIYSAQHRILFFEFVEKLFIFDA